MRIDILESQTVFPMAALKKTGKSSFSKKEMLLL